MATHGLSDVERTDLLLIPGGGGTRELMQDAEQLSWVRAMDRVRAAHCHRAPRRKLPRPRAHQLNLELAALIGPIIIVSVVKHGVANRKRIRTPTPSPPAPRPIPTHPNGTPRRSRAHASHSVDT